MIRRDIYRLAQAFRAIPTPTPDRSPPLSFRCGGESGGATSKAWGQDASRTA